MKNIPGHHGEVAFPRMHWEDTDNLKNATPNLKGGMLIFEDVLSIERNSILQLSQMRRLDPEHKWRLNRLTAQHMRGRRG